MLRSLRTLRGISADPAAIPPAGSDVINVWCRDGSPAGLRGFVTSERTFGGDSAPIPSGDLCTASLLTGHYILNHSYQFVGAHLTKHTASYQGTSVLAVDEDFDRASGFVKTSRDPAGVGTSSTYDSSGRISSIRPDGRAWNRFVYERTAIPPRVRSELWRSGDAPTGNPAADALRDDHYYYDGLGRIVLSKVRAPATGSPQWNAQRTKYDPAGRVQTVTTPVARGNASFETLSLFPGTSYTYDVFGRPRVITSPDGSTVSFVMLGNGVRQKERTTRVALPPGDSNVTTTEEYDMLGRLRSVTEFSGSSAASNPIGALLSTQYQYDGSDRLRSVTMPADAGAPQQRFFDYDGRGFLLSESHPESGATTYTYDARGNVLEKKPSDSRYDLRYQYDPAGRLLLLTERNSRFGNPGEPEFRPLKEFTFASANAGNDLRAGKLHTAIRHNDLSSAGRIEVKETYAYQTDSGQMSKRTTLVERVSGGTRSSVQQFEYSVDHDEFQLPKTITMPACSLFGCSTVNGLPSVTQQRTAGTLTSISNFATLGYHASGMVATVTHASVPPSTDTYQSVNGIPRPSAISFSGGSSCPETTPSPITAPDSVCPSSTGNSASVTPRSGVTHTWTMSGGGAITSSTTGNAITFTAPSSGSVMLTVTATDSCGAASSSKTISVASGAPTPVITAPPAVCANTGGHSASVPPQSGVTHTWTISGGTLSSSSTGNNVTFSVGSSSPVMLTVTATSSCGTSNASHTVTVVPAPTASLSGSTTIQQGGTAPLSVVLTGTAPWRVEWSDGFVNSSVSSSPLTRNVSPSVTTSYTLTSVSSSGCGGSTSGSATVTVSTSSSISPPAAVTATTQENRNVFVTWSSVSGASSYRIERTTQLGSVASFVTTTAGTSYGDVVPTSAQPVTYIYYVRSIDGQGNLSPRGAWDHATAATTLWAQPGPTAAQTIIKAGDITELRAAIDALRYAVLVSPAFSGSTAPTGLIRAADWSELVTALNAARSAIGQPAFTWSGVPAPAVGGVVLAAHIQQLREALR